MYALESELHIHISHRLLGYWVYSTFLQPCLQDSRGQTLCNKHFKENRRIYESSVN